jgi:hypothetical protein
VDLGARDAALPNELLESSGVAGADRSRSVDDMLSTPVDLSEHSLDHGVRRHLVSQLGGGLMRKSEHEQGKRHDKRTDSSLPHA